MNERAKSDARTIIHLRLIRRVRRKLIHTHVPISYTYTPLWYTYPFLICPRYTSTSNIIALTVNSAITERKIVYTYCAVHLSNTKLNVLYHPTEVSSIDKWECLAELLEMLPMMSD